MRLSLSKSEVWHLLLCPQEDGQLGRLKTERSPDEMKFLQDGTKLALGWGVGVIEVWPVPK